MLSKQQNKKPQVSPKEQMSPNTHNILLIVIIVILVGVLGVAVGYIYFGSMNHPNIIINNTTFNSTNQTNSIPNNTTSVSQTTQQKTQSTQNNIISSSQAKAIANKYEVSFGEEASSDNAGLISGSFNPVNGDPFYHVDLQWITPHNRNDPTSAGFVEIDAKTGAINPRG